MSKLKLNFLNKYNSSGKLNQSLLTILQEYVSEINEYSKEYLKTRLKIYGEGNIIDEINLFVVAPEINYEYCALEVKFYDVDSVAIIFRTLVTDQLEEKVVNISEGLEAFDKTVQEFLSSGLFNEALKFLVNQILMKRHARKGILDQIRIGEARILELTNGNRINAGFHRVEGDQIYYYTGKGLREIFKPSMTTEEKEKAQKLRQLSEEELFEKKFLAVISIHDIENII